MKRLGHAHTGRDIFDDRVLRDVHFLVTTEPHLDARSDKEGREDIQRPIIFLHNRGARRNHQAAQHNDRDNAPQKRTILIFARYREKGENQADDKDVIN